VVKDGMFNDNCLIFEYLTFRGDHDMADKAPSSSLNSSFSKKEIMFIVTVVILITGYLIIALMTDNLMGMLLLPVFVAPIVAIFFVKCLKCQLKTWRNRRSSLGYPQANIEGIQKNGLGQLMTYMGYLIYLFLFGILTWVFVLWLFSTTP